MHNLFIRFYIINMIMNPIHFFTLGYYPEYLFIGVIWGIIIGFYTYFRIKYALNNNKSSKNKKLTMKFIIPILAFICCLNIWSNAAILTLYLFFSSIIADVIRIIWKYLLQWIILYPTLLNTIFKTEPMR